jgi:hypothetical protein
MALVTGAGCEARGGVEGKLCLLARLFCAAKFQMCY